MSETANQPSPTPSPPAAVHWRSWPARDNLVHTLSVGLGLVIGGVVVYFSCGRFYLTFLAMAAVIGSMWRFFLPIVFQLDDRGVARRFLGRQRHTGWDAIGGYEVCPRGVLLLPGDDRSALAPLRTLYVPCGEHHDAVLQLVKYHLDTTDGV